MAKPEACGQIVLPDLSKIIWLKLVENAKNETLKWDILSDVQTIRLESVKRSPKIIARIVLCLFLSRMLEVGILIFLCFVDG